MYVQFPFNKLCIVTVHRGGGLLFVVTFGAAVHLFVCALSIFAFKFYKIQPCNTL